MSEHEIEHHDNQVISVLHDGSITWDELQAIKNQIWGEEAVAIEVYPSQSKTINNMNQRHIWRMPKGVSTPDLLDGWINEGVI